MTSGSVVLLLLLLLGLLLRLLLSGCGCGCCRLLLLLLLILGLIGPRRLARHRSESAHRQLLLCEEGGRKQRAEGRGTGRRETQPGE